MYYYGLWGMGTEPCFTSCLIAFLTVLSFVSQSFRSDWNPVKQDRDSNYP